MSHSFYYNLKQGGVRGLTVMAATAGVSSVQAGGAKKQAGWNTRGQGGGGARLTTSSFPLCHKDTAKGKKYPPSRGFGCLELCLYGIRELE